ncbi:MAG: alpha/beta hydrolase domain-containing protein [Candidatus Binatota bacterium]|nr:alpha/beta hydrolase domain-containing protein [Candidatus Binatota bacterium]
MKTVMSYRLLGSLALSALLTAASGADAKITGFKVTSSTEIGPFHGKSYREVTGMLEGIAPGGTYSVPAVLAFPASPADFNGFALVDVVNTVTVGNNQFPGGGRVFPVGRLHLGEDYLFGNGNIYVSVLWDRTAAGILKTGTITGYGDGIEILRDAASLARDPMLAGLAMDVAPGKGAEYVIAYGFSQSGALLRHWYAKHLNTAGGVQTFDGAILGAATGYCRNLATGGENPCSGPVADGGKTISFNTEGDAERGGYRERGESVDYRSIEIAGTSHIPADMTDFRQLGLPNQNPASIFSVVRAAFDNLQLWLKGTEPPPSISMSLKEGAYQALRDADGNALGGIRLPHMPGESPSIGAPLGTYTGNAPKAGNGYLLLGGTFEPFSKEELLARYPSNEVYVKAVSAAANDLVARRHILQADADTYIAAAKASGIGQ